MIRIMSKLQKGDKAPAINAVDQHGKKITLAQFRGKKVILYFYPKDSTPGCTAEACDLRDHDAELQKQGYQVIGVSADNDKSHIKFAEKYSLPFPLIPDTDKKIINDYGVWGPKTFMGRKFDGILRTTFIIDEKGVIEEVIEKVDTKNHTEQILGLGNQ
jgi:thioredoxin-dependent peroxiredoxin